MTTNIIRVLLVDDDEDDFLITEEFLEESVHSTFSLDWTTDYHQALEAIRKEEYDVYLLDLHLGQWSGFDLLTKGLEAGCHKPLILLTGAGEREIDQKAMNLGAADYLVKGQFSPPMLERAILYAIRHWKTLSDLRLSEERVRAVLESQSELICRFHIDTTLTFVNNAYANYFGQTAEELIGKKWLSLVPDDKHESLQKQIQAVVDAREVITTVEAGKRYGLLRWQQWTDTPIFNTDGELIEIQSVGIDITERKEAEIALRKALEKERELGELKSRFVSMASHEFRTPLTTILSTASFLEMAEEKLSSEKRLARLTKIQTAAHEMTELLNDVLLFGKAEANRLEYQPKDLDIIAFCQEIIEDIQAASGKNHEIQWQSDLENGFIYCDDKLMRQVITNLVSNAVKYSPPNSMIQVKLNGESQTFQMIVCDQGIGIPEKDQARLFEPFHRAKNVRDISGTGLGLAITKKAVELHGGTIQFESKANQGTCFTVLIPQQ